MKILFLALTIIVMGCNGFGQQKNTGTTNGNQENKIIVYFFHGTHRCTGCINAEKGTVNALNDLYRAQLDDGTIKFESINVEESKNKALAEKYEAAWNKLIFVKNGKPGQIVELTEKAFAYGIDNHVEMNKIVKTTVDKMLQ